MRRGEAPLPVGLPLHNGYAEKALAIFKSLRVPDIEGHPTYGEICDEFVFDLVRIVFGSYDPEARCRALSEFFLLIPKKNAKSTIAAAIIVVANLLNEQPDAEFLLIAPTMKISEIAYKQAAGIIRLTPQITKFYHQRTYQREIDNLNPKIPSKIAIKAADSDVITGGKNATVLIDETHVFASKPSAKGLFVEIRGNLSHPQNRHFLLQITTQSKKAPEGVFKAELNRARQVRNGEIQLPVLAMLYELPDDMVANDGWKDPSTWRLVNPNMGRSVSEQFLRDQLTAAEADGADALALLASQHFNVEIGTAQWGDGWRAAKYWDASADPTLTLETLLERSEVAVVGVDGGGDDDLCGLVVIGRERETLKQLVWAKAWAQPEVLELRPKIAPKLKDLAEEGDLTICEEGAPYQHVFEVVEICEQVRASGLLPEEGGIGLDQAGLPELVDELEKAGFEQPLVTGVPQGWRLTSAIRSLPLRFKSGTMVHAGQPAMSWSVGNAKVELKGQNLYLTKQLAGAAKVDLVIALLNAAMLMMRNPVASPKSYLEDDELLVL